MEKKLRVYIETSVISQDATHIALATLADCDVIVSWNFSHIVNLKAMTAVESVNILRKLKIIHIFSPSTLLGG